MNCKHLLLSCFVALSGFGVRAQVITQTNLPIVLINTSGGIIADTQILADMKIVDNVTGLNHPADAPAYQGNIGIRLRGSGTSPKRSYNIETWTGVWKEETDVSLLGMPSENDWVLLAKYTDRSLLRDLVGFHLFEQMGHYAPRMKLVEVMLNNAYEGVYLFGEKIKRDTGRLDIARLKVTDASGEELTGGYIFRIDNSANGYWASDFTPPHAAGAQDIRFHYEEPQDNEITPVQQTYIRDYTDSFELALNGSDFQDTLIGWRRFGANNSFEDYLIFNEIIKSSDAYRVATYLYKDKGKKLRVGPPWDLELSLFNTTDCNASKDTGWAYYHSIPCNTSDFQAPFWWEKLVTDTTFLRETKCKYTMLRPSIFDTVAINHFIDSITTYLNAEGAQSRNFAKWQVMGVPIPLLNEPLPVSATYGQEVQKIKDFIGRRIQYLDAQWYTSSCLLAVEDPSSLAGPVTAWPNPVRESFEVSLTLRKAAEVSVCLTDIYGRTVFTKNYDKLQKGQQRFNYQSAQLTPGIYLLQVQIGKELPKTIRLVKS